MSLFRFIDWPLALPEERELALRQTLRTMEEEGHMPYITSIEPLSRAESREEGMRVAVRRLVELRFGAVPEALEARLQIVDHAALDDLLLRSATAQSPTEI